jgi:hypothetical protein
VKDRNLAAAAVSAPAKIPQVAALNVFALGSPLRWSSGGVFIFIFRFL